MTLAQITRPVYTRFTIIALLLIIGLLSAGCASNTAEKSSEIQITLGPASIQSNDQIVVRVTDADGQPFTGATVSIEGNMNHAGMVPVITDPVQDDADGTADGVYQIPFEFTMLGDWILTVSVTGPDGTSYQEEIDATVTEDSITIK
jgi:hypothetical protein